MVGFYSGDPVLDPEVQAQGTDALAAPAGQVAGAVLGQAITDLPSVRFGRAMAAGDVPVVDPETGVTVYDPSTRPMLSAADANKQYGIPGVLSWDHDVAEDTAADVYQHRRADLVRQDIINRREPSVLTGGVARTGLGLLAGLLDPLNVAASFVPAVPEARVAALLAQAGGLGERTAIRAGVGAVAGAAGQAALEPLNALQMDRDREEWTPMGAMLDVLFGAGMGGILHAGTGALGDVLHGAPRLTPEQHETIAKGAIASLVEGRPVDVAPAAQLMEMWRAPTREVNAADIDSGLASLLPELKARGIGPDSSDAEIASALRAATEAASPDVSNQVGGPAQLVSELRERGIGPESSDEDIVATLRSMAIDDRPSPASELDRENMARRAVDRMSDNAQIRPDSDVQATLDAAREAVSRRAEPGQTSFDGLMPERGRAASEGLNHERGQTTPESQKSEPGVQAEGEPGGAVDHLDPEEQASLSRVAMIKQAAACLMRAVI